MDNNKRIKMVSEMLGEFSPFTDAIAGYDEVSMIGLTVKKAEPNVLEFSLLYKPKGELFKQNAVWSEDISGAGSGSKKVIYQVILNWLFGLTSTWAASNEDIGVEKSIIKFQTP